MIQDTTRVVADTASNFPWSGLIQVIVTAVVGFLSTYFGSKHGVVSGATKANAPVNITNKGF
jgi:hypothetical protein